VALLALVVVGHAARASVVLEATAAAASGESPAVQLVVTNSGTETARDVANFLF